MPSSILPHGSYGSGWTGTGPDTSTAIRMSGTAWHPATSPSATPSTRGRGVAGEAVRLILEYLREHRIGTRAAVRVDPDNVASVRVAEKSGFIPVHDFTPGTDEEPDGTPATLRLHVHDLQASAAPPCAGNVCQRP